MSHPRYRDDIEYVGKLIELFIMVGVSGFYALVLWFISSKELVPDMSLSSAPPHAAFPLVLIVIWFLGIIFQFADVIYYDGSPFI